MASELGYGQPMGGVAQTAFVVPDLQAAIARWTRDMRAGPFFVLPHFLVPGQVYRGTESKADITLAMGFAGHMLIELIQPLDDQPSVYQETIRKRGYGFHHLGIACADVDATSREYQARGYEEAFRGAVPTGGARTGVSSSCCRSRPAWTRPSPAFGKRHAAGTGPIPFAHLHKPR